MNESAASDGYGEEILEIRGISDMRLAGLFLILALFTGLTLDPLGLFWISERVFRLQQTFGSWVVWLPLIAYMLGLSLVLLGTSALFNWIERRWKASLTKTIKLQQVEVPRSYSLLVALVILSSILFAILLYQRGRVDINFILRMIWVSSGWAFGIMLVTIGLNSSTPSYIRLGLAGALLTTGALFLPLSLGGSATLVFGGWGIALGVLGVFFLRESMIALQHSSGNEKIPDSAQADGSSEIPAPSDGLNES